MNFKVWFAGLLGIGLLLNATSYALTTQKGHIKKLHYWNGENGLVVTFDKFECPGKFTCNPVGEYIVPTNHPQSAQITNLLMTAAVAQMEVFFNIDDNELYSGKGIINAAFVNFKD